MKFDKIDEESKIKPVKESLGEAIDIKQIVDDAFKARQKKNDERLKSLLRGSAIDYKKVANNPQIKAQFSRIFDLLDQLERDEKKDLVDKNSALQKQLEVAKAVKGEKEELAMKIAKSAGITDKSEIEKIAKHLDNLNDISDLG